jgi:hypothetical protein
VSILFAPPHVVTVFPEEEVTGSYGNKAKQPGANGVTVRCLISPLTSARDSRQGGPVDETFRLIARSAPITLFARIVWNNVSYSVDSVKHFDHSPETAHVECVMRRES